MFILCLIVDQTKSLFQHWLLYGIGTLFSIAMLYVITSTVLKLTINVAAALWSASVVNSILDTGAEGFSSQAMQQGGIGLLLTVLVISVPPLAATFFQGTVGNFMHFSAFGGGAASRPGPQGQPPGSYGTASYAQPQANAEQLTGHGQQNGGANAYPNQNPGRLAGNSGSAQTDSMKYKPNT